MTPSSTSAKTEEEPFSEGSFCAPGPSGRRRDGGFSSLPLSCVAVELRRPVNFY
nr:MAG TPA: hypothetical protein [Caudoviricetes sp.]